MTQGPARPLRALALFLGLWIGGRVAFLWVAAHGPVSSGEQPPKLAVVPRPTGVTPPRGEPGERPSRASPRGKSSQRIAGPWFEAAPPLLYPKQLPAPRPPTTAGADAEREDRPSGGILLPATQLPQSAPGKAVWSASVWGISRDGSGPVRGLERGVLGGSQLGTRIYRTVLPGVALTARLSTALASRQSEGALGLAVRRGAVALIAERRFALDAGGRNDWSVTAVASVADVRLPYGMRLDAYAQAGIVGRDDFADGAVRVERGIVATHLGSLSVGAGSWGGIQPGVARLDIGPQLVARTTVGGHAVRVSAEWRQRVAGSAAPGSGAVVTLGADF